jgi:MIP family channel proteins
LKSYWEQAAAEFIGTALFVFMVAASVVVLGGRDPASLVGIAVAQGLALSVLITSIGHISGGHINPAVTVGAWVVGKIESGRAALYIVVQLAGAALGAALARWALPERTWRAAHLGATLVNHTAAITNEKAVLIEAVLTFFLVFAVFAVAVDDRGAFKSIAGFGIGVVVIADILVGGPLTGASMNIARSFGPALVAGEWKDFWVYVAGPLIGALLAAIVYWFAFLRTREAVSAPRSEVPIGGGPEEDLPA